MEIPPPARVRANFTELDLYANNVQKYILASKYLKVIYVIKFLETGNKTKIFLPLVTIKKLPTRSFI